MAEARAQGRMLVLAVACLLALTAPALGQSPIVVNQRPIPPSPMGELGESDIMRAVAMIRDLGTTFGALAAREGADGTQWTIYRRTYHGAANRLDALLANHQITIRDLPGRLPAMTAGGGIVLDTTLAGRWQPAAVRTSRKLEAGDWVDISRLAGVLVEQLALGNATGDWDAWSSAHGQDLAEEAPGPVLQPLLVRFWHIQDKYLANALAETVGDSAGRARASRAAALSNDMLAVLKQVESVGGWRWRKALETVWGERDDQARAFARAASAPESVEPAEAAKIAEPVFDEPAVEPQLEAPRSADFDELFAKEEPVPLVTAAGPADDPALRADIDALYRENSTRAQESQDLGARLSDLNSQVEALAANVAGQGRQLEILIEDIAVTQTIPEALAALTASQSALERRLADLGREVGPGGLSGQLAALKAAMDSEQSRSRGAEQRLEARAEERLRALSRDVEATRRQVADLQSGLTAFRPSATAVEVPLQDAAARRAAFRQAVVAGVALLALLVAAIAFWVRGVRQRSDDVAGSEYEAMEQDAAGPEAPHPNAVQPADGEGLSTLLAGLHLADQNALRDELTQLRQDIESERSRAGDLEERLTQVTARLGESQARAKGLAADLVAVRVDTQTVGRGLLDGAARDEAMGNELAGVRQAVEAERERAKGLQMLVDELKSSVAAAKAAPSHDGEGTPGPDGPPEGPPATPSVAANPAVRRRAIEALQRSDLPGFEQAFAQLTALPLPAVERLVRHNGAQDLALACRAAGIAKPHLAAILILGRRAQPGVGHLAPQELAEAMSAYDESSAEAAEQALLGWRAQTPARGGLQTAELT